MLNEPPPFLMYSEPLRKDVPKVILFFQSRHISAKFFVIKTNKNSLYFSFFKRLV